MVFEHVVAALVHGSGYERIATPGCSDRTIRRRLGEWAELGLGEALHAAALRAYDQIIGLDLGDVAVDGCLTKAPCGGERAGPSPVDRRKGGLKRSVASDGYGIPLGIASAPGNRHDSPLLAPTLQAASQQLDGILPQDRTCHLDRGYDSVPHTTARDWARRFQGRGGELGVAFAALAVELGGEARTSGCGAPWPPSWAARGFRCRRRTGAPGRRSGRRRW